MYTPEDAERVQCWSEVEKGSIVLLLAQWNGEGREASRCDEENKKVSIPNEIAILPAGDQRNASEWF